MAVQEEHPWCRASEEQRGELHLFFYFLFSRPKIMIIICLEKEYKKERTPDGALSSRST